MRIALYGGSFDPVHLGHLLVAEAALEEWQLDQIVFIPAAQSPFKPGTQPAPPDLRCRMLRTALAGRPQFSVDTFEITRGGISYSIDTVREFRNRYTQVKLFWLIGADHVPTLPQWRDATQLAQLTEFIVIPRPGEAPAALPPPFQLHSLRGWPLKISSSEIRARVSQRKPIHFLVPPGVAATVASEGLYQPPPQVGST